jgi:hypothetical protein
MLNQVTAFHLTNAQKNYQTESTKVTVLLVLGSGLCARTVKQLNPVLAMRCPLLQSARIRYR